MLISWRPISIPLLHLRLLAPRRAMRTSRLSQDHSKLFQEKTEPLTPLRRSTRSSLARFSYSPSTTSPAPKQEEASSELTYGSDIEDAVKSPSPSPPPRGVTRTTTRKRKRTTTVTDAGKTETTTDISISSVPSPSPSKAGRRVRRPARTTTDPSTGRTVVSAPSDWEEVYAVMKAMRLHGAARNAAVDTMGCERLAGPQASARDRRFHTLVALMLSSQTKDEVNAAAMQRLKSEMPACAPGKEAGLNLENMLAVAPEVLNELIGKVGFHNNKTKFLKQAAVLLRDRHGSDIPTTIEGLTSLPGVGPKMAHLVMSAENGWNRVEGIGVDVHVHRITNLWKWHATKSPEETRLALQAWLPRDRWREINWLLVGFGQKVCKPVGRRCGECELGLRGLCPAAERKKVAEGRKVREEGKKEVDEDGKEVKIEETVEEVVIKEEVVNEAVDANQEVEAVATPLSDDLGASRKET